MTDTPILIGLTGFARSGKDTVASILERDHGFERRAIADPIKALLAAADPDVRRHVDGFGWEHVKTAHSGVRDRLQAIGAVIRREWGEDFLLGSILNDWRTEIGPRLVISDVRTNAEADLIRDYGGFIVRIERPGVGPANGDITERKLAAGIVIQNDRTIEALSVPVRMIVEGPRAA